MLIATKYQKVLLNSRCPEKFATVIPTSKIVEYKGKPLVVVPHKPEETKVLRNMGYNVPNPIKFYYNYPGQFTPFTAQLETVDFLTMNYRAFCLNEMGTGKSISVLWAYDYLKQYKAVNRMLIISPLSTMERVWADEIFKHLTPYQVSVLYGSQEKRLKLLEAKADIYIINHDGIKVAGIVEALKNRPDIDVIVVDEIASFRNSSTDRWRALNEIVNKQTPRKIWGLTGTPTPNAPTDAWAQCKLISPDSVPKFYGRFRDMVMKQVSQFKWVPRDNALDIVAAAMQPSIRFRRDECIDLPECMYETRHAPLTAVQAKAYKEMLARLAFEHSTGQVIASNEAIKASKLVQIACGAVYDGTDEPVFLGADHRIEVVKEIVEEAGGKVLVFVPFTAALEHVARELGKLWETAVVHGDTKKAERDDIFYRFQNTSDLRIIVANQGTMSHGLTLTASNTIVWFAPPNSSEQYLQTNARITRPGQKRQQLIIHIEGSEIERRMYDRLKNKQKMQGVLLDMLKGDM